MMNRKKTKESRNENKLMPGSIIRVTVGLAIGAIIGLPAYVGEARYFIEMSSGDPIRIQNAAYIWPKNEQHFMQVATTLRDNRANTALAHPEMKVETIPDYSDLAMKVARDAVKHFPHSIYPYLLLRSIPGMTTEEDILTQQKMKELDPIAYNK